MCGLSGVMSSTVSFQEETLFRDLFNVSSLRGREGSGVVVSQIFGAKKFPVIRACRSKRISSSLAYSEHLDELLKPRVNAIIGHARWPTKGGIDINAVHPHRAGHIVGVHNGTLWKVAGEDVKDRSDSAMLFESFAKIGVEETMKNTEGAYALVWINEQDQTINFLRNAQRTLYFKNVGWQENCSTIFWASEREMLDFVFARSFKGNNFWDTYLPIHRWYKYPLEVKHIIRPISVVDCKPEEKPVVMHYRGSNHYHGHRANRRAWEDDWDAVDQVDQYPFEDPTRDLPWVRVTGQQRDNILHLPRPVNVEDRLKELAARPSGEASAEVQQPKPLSKQAQKRARKQYEKEVRDEAKRLARFQRDLAKKANPPKEVGGTPDETQLMDSPVDDLNQDVPELGIFNTHNQQSTDDRTPVRLAQSTNYIECVGRGCAWCGTVAEIGDNVYPTSNDMTSKDFICTDCGSKPDIICYVRDVRTSVAT